MANLSGIISARQTLTSTLGQRSAVPLSATIERAQTVYVDDYEDLRNKPQINGVELIGNKSLDDLGDVALTNLEIYELVRTVKGR